MSNVVMNTIKEQNDLFIDRFDEIQASWLALLSGQHIFLAGRPGVAKSMLSVDMTRRILGADIFSYLLRKDTTPSEIFGPPSLKALENDQYKFITTGRLPEAHIAFLDEIWKAGSNILNSLLTAVNERQFDNGGARISIPLMTVFAASNELPQGEELGAIYDRFLIRLLVRDLESDGDFFKLLDERPNLKAPPTNTVSLADLQAMQADVAKVDTSGIVNTLVELRNRLTAEVGITFSSRRWLQGLSVVQAHAYLNDRKVADMADLEVYKWILWDALEQRSKVARIVMGAVNPLNEKFLELMDEGEEQYQKIQSAVQTGSTTIMAEGTEANQKMKNIIRDLLELGKQGDSAFTEKVNSGVKKLRSYNKWIVEQSLGVEL